MNTKQVIKTQIQAALKSEFDYKIDLEEIHLERPQNPEHGDWSSNIAMKLANELKQNPKAIAEGILAELDASGQMLEASIAGPGFINFKLSISSFVDNLGIILKQKENYGNSNRLKGKRIMVEFAHPNPFKPFHIGHLRNIILGETIVRMLESQGAEVIRTNYQGDVGMHIAKNLWAFQKVHPKNYPNTTDEKVKLLGKLYAEGATAFENDKKAKEEIKEINKKIYSKEDPKINKLWELGKKWSLEKFHEIYERVYTTFDREYFESETLATCMKYAQKAKEQGILTKSEGAVIFDGSKYNMDTRVFINSQGLPTYECKELGLGFMEFRDFGKIDLCIHNVAVEHKSYFEVLFKVKELLDPKLFKGKQYHNAYEFVGLKKGKMSSRKGQVVLGEDILDEAHERIAEIINKRIEGTQNPTNSDKKDLTAEMVGVAAIKWSFLKISPFKYLKFDMEESINFEGDSGPYIQYTYARAKSILRQDSSSKLQTSVSEPIMSKEERSLLKWLERFPETIELASLEYAPNYITTYLFELAQKFNSFYKNNSVLNAEEERQKEFRLALTKATSIILAKGLKLLGIKTVEKM